jgi:hypothetical protein
MMSLHSRPDPALKRVATRTALAFAPAAPGLTGVNIMAGEHAIEPFLVFTEFRMDRAASACRRLGDDLHPARQRRRIPQSRQ